MLNGRAVGGAVLGGLFAYALADATNDAVTYSLLKRQAMQTVEEHVELKQQLGCPYAPGPWYNSSITFTHAGHIANMTFTLHGAQSSTEVSLRAVRRTFPWGTLLYNLVGPGEWQVVVMEALVPSGGGLPRAMSLLGTGTKLSSEATGATLQGSCPTSN